MTSEAKPEPSTKTRRIVLGFLVALALVCVVTGYGLRNLSRTYRSRDARTQLELLWTMVLTYSVEQRSPEERQDGGDLYRGLPPSVGPSPEGTPGKRALRWVDDPGSVWARLRFRPANDTFFVYSVIADRDAGTLVLRAEGDLDGDGVRSRYEIRARNNAFGVPERDPGVFAENDGE